MNIDTGELVRLIANQNIEESGLIPVPDEFSELAEKKLGQQDRIFVDMAQDTLLTRWVKDERKKKKKSRRKMAKKSKRINYK